MNEVNNDASHESEGSQPDTAEADAKFDAGDEKEAEVLEGADLKDSGERPVDADEGVGKDPDRSEEVAALKDQLLRSAAEFENLKRRSARDVENAHKFGAEKLISDLLPVLDSLDKAVELASQTEGAEAMTEGIELSVKMFLDALGKNGLREVDPLGEPFDPALHEALAAVPNEDAEPNTVMEVIQKGYSLNDRLVRAAKVVVVKE